MPGMNKGLTTAKGQQWNSVEAVSIKLYSLHVGSPVFLNWLRARGISMAQTAQTSLMNGAQRTSSMKSEVDNDGRYWLIFVHYWSVFVNIV